MSNRSIPREVNIGQFKKQTNKRKTPKWESTAKHFQLDTEDDNLTASLARIPSNAGRSQAKGAASGLRGHPVRL